MGKRRDEQTWSRVPLTSLPIESVDQQLVSVDGSLVNFLFLPCLWMEVPMSSAMAGGGGGEEDARSPNNPLLE